MPLQSRLAPDARMAFVSPSHQHPLGATMPSARRGALLDWARRADGVFATARLLSDRHSSIADQAVLAEFISAGHYARHVRRMRGLYAERQDALLEEAARSLAGLVEINRTDAGMNAIAWLPAGIDDVAAYRAALAEGVEAPPLTPFAQAPLSARRRPPRRASAA